MSLEAQIGLSINLGLFLLGVLVVFRRTGSLLNFYGFTNIIGAVISLALLALTTVSDTLVTLLTQTYQGFPAFALLTSTLVVFFLIALWQWWLLDSAVSKATVRVEGLAVNIDSLKTRLSNIEENVEKQRKNIEAVQTRINERYKRLLEIQNRPM